MELDNLYQALDINMSATNKKLLIVTIKKYNFKDYIKKKFIKS